VNAKHAASLAAQKLLDDIDTQIAAAEASHETQLAGQAALAAGDTGPYKQAIKLMSDTLAGQNMSYLNRLAAQTRTREDDAAVDALRELARAQDDLLADQKEAKNLLGKYQGTLSELQNVRYGRRNSGIDIGDVFGVLEGIARSSRRSSGGWSGAGRSGGWGSSRTTRRRTSIPRRPRQSLPKVRFPKSGGFGGGRRRGGFKTGGGF